MPNKAQLKMLLTVTAGVIAAGYVMSQFRDVGVIADARDGFGR
ncbi:hypothetical protein WG622_02580 [Cognatishimia sp. D5M38]|uniref:Uncharacterized protein n=1 Tax=Cognatishimia coralii TaxID=3083254 RepID=A0ABU8QCG5_9RHOB